jgi:hypothetical protein
MSPGDGVADGDPSTGGPAPEVAEALGPADGVGREVALDPDGDGAAGLRLAEAVGVGDGARLGRAEPRGEGVSRGLAVGRGVGVGVGVGAGLTLGGGVGFGVGVGVGLGVGVGVESVTTKDRLADEFVPEQVVVEDVSGTS